MGKMGYSADFGTVKAGGEDRMLHLIEVSFKAIGQIGQLSWPIALSKDLNLSPEQTEFETLACELADEREKASGQYSIPPTTAADKDRTTTSTWRIS
jgi:tryprostatin B 6-hydroxylase